MKVILNIEEYNDIWNKLYRDFLFSPSDQASHAPWISFPMESRKYRLHCVFSKEQEKIINSIFCRVNAKDMYALDWQHDCFIYNPCEEILSDDWFYDADRDCNVYFPSYYPNGDYHFFASFDWSVGLYGHPWKKEMIVVGETLIQEFETMQSVLPITEL
ncbi:MAG: DUF2716 domain-containing protein [Lachnospiraceae bacterium]|nr:DUF2716 domain-containing protein [Lachnospiraceae bacterium]